MTNHYTPGDTRFTGTTKWIEVKAVEDSHDQLINPEGRCSRCGVETLAASTAVRTLERV